jgi:hypothetical protein
MRARPGQADAVERTDVERWVTGYERLWRTPGTEQLGVLFSRDVSYLPSPWARPLVGLEALTGFWESARDGPDEKFSMRRRVVAVDGSTAVVRVEVDYDDGEGGPSAGRWRDLWILDFDPDGRCRAFEEWPFAPDQSDGHG